MSKKLVLLKNLIQGQGWEHIVKICTNRRNGAAINLILHKQSEKLMYTEADMLRDRISIYNAILQIPEKLEVEGDEDIEDKKLVEEGNLDIGDVNELFTTKE